MPKFVDLLGTAAPRTVGNEAWIDVFANVARVLLASRLRVNDRSVDLCEIEFYLHRDDHPDPFVHRDPMQRCFGRWYFHRVGENYRGGTFKGLDITFGFDGYYGGVLIRSLRTPEGRLINGSSLSVDYLLAITGHRSVSSLATMLSRYSVDASISPLSLACVGGGDHASIWQTPRVGLSLARAARLSANARLHCSPIPISQRPSRNQERTRSACRRAPRARYESSANHGPRRCSTTNSRRLCQRV